MKILAILVASGLINFQQPLKDNLPRAGENEQLTRLAINYLKLRYHDADFIQSSGVNTADGSGFHVYLVFSAESTSIDHCVIHINNDQSLPRIEHISCMDYNTKLGFKEKVYHFVNH